MKNVKILLSIIACAGILFVCGCSHEHFYDDWCTSAINCVTDGYMYRTCKLCGQVEYGDVTVSGGHEFVSWSDDIINEARYGTCSLCGAVEEDGEYSPLPGFSRFYIYGTPSGTVIPVEAKYVLDDVKHEFFGNISIDGHESNEYYKKDYDIITFSDSEFSLPVKTNLHPSIGDVGSYALKSEYYDKSSVRNLVASELWRQVVSSRESIDENIAALPHLGAESGFPLFFYTNGNFKGIYNLCTPNNEELFSLTDENNQSLIYSYTDFGTFDFTYGNSDNAVPCTVVWPTDVYRKQISAEKFCEFMNFIDDSTDKEFKKEISSYLDVDAAIDYLICLYAFGADSNTVKYCNWVSFDNKKWIPSMYNLTYTFGLDEKRKALLPQSTVLPYIGSDGKLISGTSVAFWDKLCASFADKIALRYGALRQSVLSYENIGTVFESYVSMIPQKAYDAEITEYPEKADFTAVYSVQDISQWYSEKCVLLDSVFKTIE